MNHGARSRSTCIAIDTGGTFTDCIWLDKGKLRILKVFSTPSDPSRAITEALQQIRVEGRLILLHGTTVGTNTVLQRKGARLALVTTAGFEDVIEIGRQARPKLYDLFFDRVEPLVPCERRFGVEERTSNEGKVLRQPSEADLRMLAEKLSQANPEAIAISLLFSFANPQNEKQVAEGLENLHVPLSISHEILPEFREYERTSTVVMNAYLQPVMQNYLENLQRRVLARRRATSLFVMQSSGGITALQAAARHPVRTLLSGPAGGIVGAAKMAKRSGFVRIISFDMGGTSTDVSLVDREAKPSSQSEIAGLPVGVPMLDIHTVGAGGGSIARFDAAGALRVGPESAGADPGPICYGRGTEPTVTDANLLLGRVRADRFLGGNFIPDVERTRRVVTEWLNKSTTKLSLGQFAAGIIRVVNATMEKAIRVVSIERGYDPRQFALVAFGGAGGLHACELAEALAIPWVIVPALPGALSAFGILVSEVVKDYSRTVLWRALDDLPLRRIDEEFGLLRREAESDFRTEKWHGRVVHRSSVDVRYRGQGYELNIPYTRGLHDAFRREHVRRYGYSYPRREIELVTLRLRATMKSPMGQLTSGRLSVMTPAEPVIAHVDRAPVSFDGRKLSASICPRDCLQPGKRLAGPAIVTEYSATTVIPPGKQFWIDHNRNLLIQITSAKARATG
ncbi:MAG TPA: hydantoinase/oxoprolinase family protein [Terriglobales bacterium]|nr:hydantoinase/oxoprolinase family protein [Terriglobales bacterium]